jgi:hypothetical protein
MVKPQNKVDRDRFGKLKFTETDRGRDEKGAAQLGADEVKEIQRRDDHSKEPPPNNPQASR